MSQNFSVTHAMKTLCDLQLDPLIQLLDSAGQNGTKFVRNSTTDPVLYLDRLAAIYRYLLNYLPKKMISQLVIFFLSYIILLFTFLDMSIFNWNQDNLIQQQL